MCDSGYWEQDNLNRAQAPPVLRTSFSRISDPFSRRSGPSGVQDVKNSCVFRFSAGLMADRNREHSPDIWDAAACALAGGSIDFHGP
jgi:hypothetical protein